jgi:hypothetical protein
MSDGMNLEAAQSDLVIANRILANEGVIDAFGHVSIRPARSIATSWPARGAPNWERGDWWSSTSTTGRRPRDRTMYSSGPSTGPSTGASGHRRSPQPRPAQDADPADLAHRRRSGRV